MPWFRSPVMLFGSAGLLLFIARLVFPPADFVGAPQLHFYAHFFDLRLDLTGYGVFEFVALIFVLSAVSYYLLLRLTKRPPRDALVQLHFWPSLMFAVFSVFLAHWINRIPPTEVHDSTVQESLNNWFSAFSWAFLVFLAVQIAFAIGAVRSIWLNKNAVTRG